jgi:hypothetical protein
MFKKIKGCSADKSDNSGSHCSTSSTFQVKQMSVNGFNCWIYMCYNFFGKRDQKFIETLVQSFLDIGSHTVTWCLKAGTTQPEETHTGSWERKNMVIDPGRARNQEWLCLRSPAAIYQTWPDQTSCETQKYGHRFYGPKTKNDCAREGQQQIITADKASQLWVSIHSWRLAMNMEVEEYLLLEATD